MTQLNRYTLLEKIGSSVLGAVYKARDNATGSLVALKVLQLGLLDDVSSSEMDARLQRNFEAASRLQHPGIARVFEIRRDGRTALIASELVEGPRITSLAKTVTGSDVSQVVAACIQLLETLDFAHNQLLIHRDLKPSNVLIQGGRVKITDFGMSDLGARNRAETGALVGETEYMAPEQFLSGTIDKRCDIHAVGTILYELLTGQSPFRGDPNTASAMFKVLDVVPPPPSQIRPGLSPAFDKLVGRALAKKPAQRFVTAREFRNELFEVYIALAGRPPPRSLSAVDSESQGARPEVARTTLIQSRPTSQAPSPISEDQRQAVPGSPDANRSAAPPQPSTAMTSESMAPLSLNPMPPAVTPATTARETAASSSSPEERARSIPPAAALTDSKLDPLPVGTVLARPSPGGTSFTRPGVDTDVRISSNGQVHTEDATDPLSTAPVDPARPAKGPADPSPEATAPRFSGVPPSPASSSSAPPMQAESQPAAPQQLPLREASSAPGEVQRPRPAPLPAKHLIPLTNESITHGGRVLAQFIGPIAMVFSRRAAEAAQDERGYFDMLAAHLSDPDERAQFLRKLRQRPA